MKSRYCPKSILKLSGYYQDSLTRWKVPLSYVNHVFWLNKALQIPNKKIGGTKKKEILMILLKVSFNWNLTTFKTSTWKLCNRLPKQLPISPAWFIFILLSKLQKQAVLVALIVPALKSDLGMSLDSKSAHQVTTNHLGYFEAWNLSFFGLFKENMTTSLDNWKVVTNFLVKTVTQYLFLSCHCL